MSALGSCPVVRIAVPVAPGNPDGFTEINATDFNSAVHKLYCEPDTDAKAQLVAAEKAALLKAEAEKQAAVDAAELEAKLGWGIAPPPAA